MKKYISNFKNAVKTAMIYKFEFFMWGANSLIMLFMYFYFWQAIFENNPEISGFTLESMVSYILIATLINRLLPTWHWGRISELITSGDIVVELIKPYNIIIKFYFWQMGMGISSFIFNLIPFIGIGILFFNLQGPTSVLHSLAIIASIFLATIIAYFIWLFVGLTAFYTTNVWGVYTTMLGVNLFLTGSLIPLDLMPQWLGDIVYILPFQNTVYTPVSIYLGNISLTQVPGRLLIQLLWSIALYFLSDLYYKKALNKLIVQGG